MTESEIMKALECCATNDKEYCKKCPCDEYECLTIPKTILNLINRKNAEIAEKDAEIEGLSVEIDELIIAKDKLFDEAEALIKKARSEAIKEFAERVKGNWEKDFCLGITICQVIDQIAKEMWVEL